MSKPRIMPTVTANATLASCKKCVDLILDVTVESKVQFPYSPIQSSSLHVRYQVSPVLLQ